MRYINIQEFMLKDLKLSWNELLIYAIIFWFSQDFQNTFNCSYEKLASFLNLTKMGVIKIIKKLEEKWLIEKIKGNEFWAINSYRVTKVCLEDKKSLSDEVNKVYSKNKQSLPNNNIYNNNYNNINKNNNNIFINENITEKQDFSDFSESLENFENKKEEIIEATPDNISRLSHKHFEEVETPKERPTFWPNPKKEKRKISAKKKKESNGNFEGETDGENEGDFVEAEIVEETQVVTYGNQNINQIIAIMQAELEANGLFYQKEWADRNYAKHICTAKEFGAIAEKFGMNRAEFVVNIIRLSCESDFWRGKICNPRSLYKGYVKVLNEASARQFRKSQEKEYNFDLTNWNDDFFSN